MGEKQRSPEKKAQGKTFKNKFGLAITLRRLLPDVGNILVTIIWLLFYLHLRSNKTNSIPYYFVQSRGTGKNLNSLSSEN